MVFPRTLFLLPNSTGRIRGMTFRLILSFALLMLPIAGHAADCVKVVEQPDALGRPSEYASIIRRDCGALKVVDRRRDDPRAGVNVYASYVVFDPPRSVAERRYNDWIGRRPSSMTFSGDVELTPAGNHDETLSGMLYRSARLLSASDRTWVCCGAHGSASSEALNIDPVTGRDVRLDELVDIVAAATLCEKSLTRGRGKKYYAADDLPEPTESFLDKVRSAWSVREAGLFFDFGYMRGYADGYFTCEIGAKDLRRIAKPGVSVPF